MNERDARTAAAALHGEAWQSGGNIWLVRMKGADGQLVVLSDDLICEYPDEAAFHEGKATRTIELAGTP